MSDWWESCNPGLVLGQAVSKSTYYFYILFPIHLTTVTGQLQGQLLDILSITTGQTKGQPLDSINWTVLRTMTGQF